MMKVSFNSTNYTLLQQFAKLVNSTDFLYFSRLFGNYKTQLLKLGFSISKN